MMKRTFSVLLAMLLLMPFAAAADRIKDMASIQGVRDNQLLGYGLVVGLDGSGDQTTQTPFTVQSIISMLSQMGINLPPGTSLQHKNVAAVMVTAPLPPFSKPGQTIDVTASSMGNAKSLRGGTLLMTPLKGADGQVYAMSQGNVLVGGGEPFERRARSGRRDSGASRADTPRARRVYPSGIENHRLYHRCADRRSD